MILALVHVKVGGFMCQHHFESKQEAKPEQHATFLHGRIGRRSSSINSLTEQSSQGLALGCQIGPGQVESMKYLRQQELRAKTGIEQGRVTPTMFQTVQQAIVPATRAFG